MPRIQRLASALALALAASGAAQAQQFSGVVSFGDSLSDAGNIAQLNGLPAGNSFTTNFDPVAVQVVASYYGYTQTNAQATGSPFSGPVGGTNYAYGGACIQSSAATPPGHPGLPLCVNGDVDPDGAGPRIGLAFTRVSNQIGTYLSRNGGSADPHALYTLWAGANDINAALSASTAVGGWQGASSAATQANIIAGVVPIATAFTTQAARLQAAGAHYIVVFNLPDLGITPQVAAAGSTAASGATLASLSYNNALNTGLATLHDGIIPINTFALVNEVRANVLAGRSDYGITNITGIACGPGAPGVVSSVACGPAGSGLPYTYAAGTNNTYLFADGIHPSGAAHRLLADVVVATIAAPSVVALAPEVPLKAYFEHSRAVDESLLSLWGDELEAGSVRAYGSIQGGNQDIQADDYSPGLDSNYSSLSLGANYRMSDAFTFGAAISVGTQDADTGSIGRIEGVSVIGSIYGQYQNNGWYVRGMLGGGSTSLDITRNIQIGPLLRQEIGKPGVSQQAVSAEVGYMFEGDSLQHGPFANFGWQKLSVEAYSEEGVSSTAMNFSEFERKSQLTSLGYQIQGSIGSEGNTFQPFARVAWVSEDENGQTYVNAGSNSMNGRFTLGGVTPSKEWIDASIGVSAEFGDDLSAFVSLNGHVSDDEQEGGDFSLGVRKTF